MRAAALGLIVAIALAVTASSADARPPRYGVYYNPGFSTPSFTVQPSFNSSPYARGFPTYYYPSYYTPTYAYPTYVYPAGGFPLGVSTFGVTVGGSYTYPFATYGSYYYSQPYYGGYYRRW
jgi:hypothetical protein